jgi:hypothetical protein
MSDFLANNREKLIRRCAAKVTIRPRGSQPPNNFPAEFRSLLLSSKKHLRPRNSSGLRRASGYGDLCQAITDLAFERDAPFAIPAFRTLNRGASTTPWAML